MCSLASLATIKPLMVQADIATRSAVLRWPASLLSPAAAMRKDAFLQLFGPFWQACGRNSREM